MTEDMPVSGLFGPGFQLDPHPRLAAARAAGPLIRIEHPFLGTECWLALTYPAVRTVLADDRLVKPAEPGEPPSLNSSPPAHTRLRRLIQQAFTQRQVRALGPRIQALVDEMLDPLLARGSGDLVSELTNPLPIAVTCELVGVPRSDWAEVNRRTTGFAGGESADLIAEAFQMTWDYAVEFIAAKRACPGEDLTSALIAARDGSDRLSEDELIRLLMTLLVNGYLSSIKALANSVHALLDHPDQLALVAARPDLIDSAIEELLRFESPVTAVTWTAATDVVIEGVPVRADELVVTSFQAANRDPDYFTDPDRLDICRNPNPHLAFSHGIHHCLGKSLAQLEMRIVLETLLRRCPGLRLNGQARRQETRVVRGFESIPVALDSESVGSVATRKVGV
ncbi:cytochrome P450 family protein [Nocardia arthritidis]|uniref:Cytochrome P450 n=1 Tax=Nocardia arthritidis TaxID=228602 RepID=A0A6G9Y9W0_9NOCA|nr:cytochrome P450 [Nocardia arthritidis]QIS10055.1 cytochrome P450 [Nocardia arthritidis]